MISVLPYLGHWAIQRQRHKRAEREHIAGPFESAAAAMAWIAFRKREREDWSEKMVGSPWLPVRR
jgi:hypothetical protein